VPEPSSRVKRIGYIPHFHLAAPNVVLGVGIVCRFEATAE
jgi:hypothetical protein